MEPHLPGRLSSSAFGVAFPVPEPKPQEAAKPRPVSVPLDPGSGRGANSRDTLPIRGRKAPEGPFEPPGEASLPQGRTPSRRPRVRCPDPAVRFAQGEAFDEPPGGPVQARRRTAGQGPESLLQADFRIALAEAQATLPSQQVSEGLRFRHPQDASGEDRHPSVGGEPPTLETGTAGRRPGTHKYKKSVVQRPSRGNNESEIQRKNLCISWLLLHNSRTVLPQTYPQLAGYVALRNNRARGRQGERCTTSPRRRPRGRSR